MPWSHCTTAAPFERTTLTRIAYESVVAISRRRCRDRSSGRSYSFGFSPLSRVAYRTLHGCVCAALGEEDAVPGVVSLAQSFSSLAHWHPHLHLVVTDGGFRRDGSFVAMRAHEPAVLAEAWRRAVLALFVREDRLEVDAAVSMLAWPHSGFSAYVGPAIAVVVGPPPLTDRADLLVNLVCQGVVLALGVALLWWPRVRPETLPASRDTRLAATAE